MQSSIAMLIAAIEVLHDKLGQRDYEMLTIHCNADEETGSNGSRALIQELGRIHHVSYNMEQSGKEGELITISGRRHCPGHAYGNRRCLPMPEGLGKRTQRRL